jgi:hypothetical protein
MTLSEFKYWLEGFSDNIKEAPTPEQWEKIKQKLEQVKTYVPLNLPASPPLYPDPFRKYWGPYNVGTSRTNG